MEWEFVDSHRRELASGKLVACWPGVDLKEVHQMLLKDDPIWTKPRIRPLATDFSDREPWPCGLLMKFEISG